MNILHIISQHPESTGSGYYIQNIIRQAANCGHSNYLIAGISDNKHPLLDCIEPESCHFVRFNQAPLNFTIPGMSDVMPYESSRFYDLTPEQISTYTAVFTDAIKRAVVKFKPDIIHSHHLWLSSCAARVAAPNIPLVTSCHSTDIRQYLQCEHLRQQVKPHCQNIDRILALTHSQAEKIEKVYDINSAVIDIVGGGYDASLFSPNKDKKDNREIHLLYAGKLCFTKGVDWLLEAFNTISQDSVHLHLAGSGNGKEEELCRRLARRNNDTVTIHGKLEQSELAKLMHKSDIFILPSFYEGLPLVLLEALASGCRVITTDLAGCKELLGGASNDLVTFINLPPMTELDQPGSKDKEVLRIKLSEAIKKMIATVRHTPLPSLHEIEEITVKYRWPTIFKKISKTYNITIQKKNR